MVMEEKIQSIVKPDESEAPITGRQEAGSVRFWADKGQKKRAALLVLVLLFWLALVQYMAADKYSVAVKVGEANARGDSEASVDFGALASGGSAARFITLSDQGDKGIYVWVLKSGSVARFLKIDPDSFYLAPGQTKKMELTLEAPSGGKGKEYQGQVIILKVPRIF